MVFGPEDAGLIINILHGKPIDVFVVAMKSCHGACKICGRYIVFDEALLLLELAVSSFFGGLGSVFVDVLGTLCGINEHDHFIVFHL